MWFVDGKNNTQYIQPPFNETDMKSLRNDAAFYGDQK